MSEPKIGQFDGNNYDLTRRELRKTRKEIQKDLGLSKSEAKAQMKEVKAHIKAGDLGEYLDKLGDDMKGIMGLHLNAKIEKHEGRTYTNIDELVEDIKNLDIANANRADKQEAFHATDNPLIQAYTYGPLKEIDPERVDLKNTQPTAEGVLNFMNTLEEMYA